MLLAFGGALEEHNDLAKRRALARPVEAEGRNELERLVMFHIGPKFAIASSDSCNVIRKNGQRHNFFHKALAPSQKSRLGKAQTPVL